MCKLCFQKYTGESGRSCHERLGEHYRFANNPDSYPKEALAIHYKNCHPGQKADLLFSLLDRERSVVKRKIKEAYFIISERPEINLRDELTSLERYLVCLFRKNRP